MSIKWFILLYKHFLKFCSKTIIILIDLIILIIGIIIKCLKTCKLFVITNRSSIVQLVCVLFMICNGFVLIFDYLNFYYELKLIISKNDRGINWPAISVCTESNALFDKRNILNYFDLVREYSEKELKAKKQYNCSNNCRPYDRQQFFRISWDYYTTLKCCNYVSKYIRNDLLKYIEKFDKLIIDNLSYAQMIALTMTGEELFECRASVHFKNQTIGSNPTIIDDCFQRFRVSRDIYSDNNFGICYKFFDTDYQIRIENKDFIEIKIKYGSLNNLKYHLKLYYFIEGDTNLLPNKDNSFSTIKHGLKLNAIIKSVSFEMLSIPYMQLCQRKG